MTPRHFDHKQSDSGQQPDQEDIFDDDAAEGRTGGRAGWQKMLLIVALFVMIGGTGIYFLRQHVQQPPSEPVIIDAQAGPFKEKPADQGGLDIPYQDATIYNEIAGEDIKSSSPQKYEHYKLGEVNAVIEEPKPEQQPEPVSEVKEERPIEKQPDPVKTTDTIEKTEEPQPEVPQATGAKRIQLGAFPEKASAERYRSKLMSESSLKNKKILIEKATDKNKKIIYRLQVPGLSAEQAKALCDQLKQAKRGCFLVH